MLRCEDHKQLDYYSDLSELYAQKLGINDRRTQRAHGTSQYYLAKIRNEGHSINYSCPDDEDEE
jgi:hypothetical protein